MQLAGIEAGGTKFVIVIGDEHGKVVAREHIPTTTTDETMPSVINFLKQHTFSALGIACFGPIDPNPESKTYGYITSTPKLSWRNYNILGALKQAFPDTPMHFDTDVNGAALGEHYWGNGRDCKNFIYLTVGTGIGGGVMLEGKLLHGVMHPEMGHVLIPQDANDPFPGICPYHGNCLEGLASGPAIKARWHVESALDLAPEHPAWDFEADYLAAALMNYLLCFAPERIILGGGVMKQKQLLPLIQAKTRELLNGYLQNSSIESIEKTIVLAGLGQEAGNMGALALAKLGLC
jgi:fructokinase